MVQTAWSVPTRLLTLRYGSNREKRSDPASCDDPGRDACLWRPERYTCDEFLRQFTSSYYGSARLERSDPASCDDPGRDDELAAIMVQTAWSVPTRLLTRGYGSDREKRSDSASSFDLEFPIKNPSHQNHQLHYNYPYKNSLNHN